MNYNLPPFDPLWAAIQDAKLPMEEVAARAGFASLRRFNAVFAEVYERTPTQLRRLRFKTV